MASVQQPHHEEETFRNYDAKAAARYNQYRKGWSESFIQNIISQHTSTGGETDVLLDIGCGPGNSTRDLARHVQHALGVDPSPSMIETARGLGGETASGEPVKYAAGKAEELSLLSALAEISPGTNGRESVDLITASVSIHWFNMPLFWAEAAKLLKPGGSVIAWCAGGFHIDPNTTPNATKAQQVLDRFEAECIQPYFTEGNVLCRELYRGLKLPWDCADGDQELLSLFDKKDSTRLEYNRDGHVAPGQTFVRGGRMDFAMMKQGLSTASTVTRWRRLISNNSKRERWRIFWTGWRER